MRPNSEHALINPTSGFTVISVIRCPLAGSGESAVSGGQVWGSIGPADGTTPGLRISESTGRPLLRAGGVSITANPPDIDLRDGAFHIIRCSLDVASMRLRINVDKGRASQVAVLTAPLPVVDPAVPNALAPILGLQLTSAGAGTFPCYGQHASHLYFNSGALSLSELSAVENYLAARYGVVLV